MQDEQLPLYTDVHTDSSQVRGVLVSVKPIKNDKWGCKVSIKREEENTLITHLRRELKALVIP